MVNKEEKKGYLVIISPKQFGYSLGYFYYCEYLSDFSIIYLCRNQGLKHIDSPSNTEVHFISGHSFLISTIIHLKKLGKRNIYAYFINYQRFCSMYTFFLNNGKRILDIRTGEISKNPLRRYILNYLVRAEAFLFDNIFVLSESLRNYLQLPIVKSHITPLGAVDLGYADRKYDRLSLLYVGTFFNRDIYKTIKGLAIFKERNPHVPVSYTIIGFGPERDKTRISKEMANNNFSDKDVKILGRIHQSEMRHCFIEANVGVSFIPIVDYFNVQPATKTLEYIISGLICIATATPENSRVINHENGILIRDSEVDFAEGLEKIWVRRKQYDSAKIKNDSLKHSWFEIVNNCLRPALELAK